MKLKLSDLQFIFNRAFTLSLSLKKNLLVFVVLALCGVFVVFCRALAIYASQWIVMSLTFLPIFLSSGLLLSTGIMLIRIYHDEVKGRDVSFTEVFAKSWEVVIGSSYFSIPVILSYLLLWVMLGLFVLLREIPGMGEFFSVIFSFGPFLLNLGSLVLCLISVGTLYLITPILALRGINRLRTSNLLMDRLKSDPFVNILLAGLALFPLVVCSLLLILAAFLTGSVCYGCNEAWQHALQWFFVMIPFTALLSPSVLFFFNMAAEAHVLIMRNRP